MKVAIIFNRESQRVINLFGVPNQEKYGKKNIQRIVDALKAGGHQVAAFEGDKDLITNLEDFMPRVVKGERPGMVFNLSYGIQGQARYTHVPGMLEMIGLPYVGSGPLAHSLALDKVVSKMIFKQNGLPTADFAVLQTPKFELPDLKFPVIVKPKNEAVSFGLRICRNEKELREGADAIFRQFNQPVLVEQYIDGREINVGLLGNSPPDVLPPAEISFGKTGPQIYTYEDKTRKSGREIQVICPAQLGDELTARAKEIAQRAFEALSCFDCARVDMRLDKDGHFYILEINSLPSLGEHGSYVQGAAAVGLDFVGLCNRLVEVASARYFGTPSPPELKGRAVKPGDRVFRFLTERRDRVERELREWTRLHSRTYDPVGIRAAADRLSEQLEGMGMKPVAEFTDEGTTSAWQTPEGFENGTLLVGHLDVPTEPNVASQMYHRDTERIFGEGVGSSRAPLVAMLFALRALRHARRLRKIPLGVLYYADEGHDCRFSGQLIHDAAARARNVLVLRPGSPDDRIVNARRGQRRYRLVVSGDPLRLGQQTKKAEVLPWAFQKLEKCGRLTSRKDRVAVATLDISTRHLPLLLPHEVTATILVSYPEENVADGIDQKMRDLLEDKAVHWNLELIAARPPMKERRSNKRLTRELRKVADEWGIPLETQSSVWPSAAGLVPASTGAVCGIGPVARNLYTPQESVDRISLIQRTLLLAEFLAAQ